MPCSGVAAGFGITFRQRPGNGLHCCAVQAERRAERYVLPIPIMESEAHIVDAISILVSLDQAYLPQLQVLLTSIFCNNPGERFNVYLLHSGISDQDLAPVAEQCRRMQDSFCPIRVQEDLFAGAPTTRQYPREMYYRLLAGQLLPGEVKRVIYLDPDILVLNPLRPLWELELGGNLFAAAAHTGKTELANNVNRLRLGTRHDYYNSGVLLMDLEACRARVVQGWQIAVTSTIPNVLMAFVIIKILDHSGLLKLIGTALDPIMGIFGLPGEAATVLLGGWMSMGGGVGVAVALFDHGTITGHDIAVLAPSIYLMGSQVQYMGRCLGVIGIKGSKIPLIMAIPVLTAFVSLFVMRILMLGN